MLELILTMVTKTMMITMTMMITENHDDDINNAREWEWGEGL